MNKTFTPSGLTWDDLEPNMYGSIAKFFECEERTRIEKDQARRKWQMEQLAAV